MKRVSLIIVCFCLLVSSYSSFAQSKTASSKPREEVTPEVLNQFKQDLQILDVKIKKETDPQKRAKYETEYDRLYDMYLKMEQAYSQKQLEKKVSNIDDKSSEILKDTKKLYEGKQDFHEAYDKYFFDIVKKVDAICQLDAKIEEYEDRQQNVIAKLNDNIARITNKSDLPKITMKDVYEKKPEMILNEKFAGFQLSAEERSMIQGTTTAAREKFQELEEKKKELKKFRDDLLARCSDCREEYNKRK